MAQQGHTDDEPDFSQLYVYAGPEQPDLSDMTVYAHEGFTFNPPAYVGREGVPAQANIIGASHYINTGAFPYQYHEITSCRPIDMVRGGFRPVVVQYDITTGIDDTLIRSLGNHRIELSIRTRAFDPPYNTEAWDLAHIFDDGGSGAPTAIDFRPQGWDTLHTYSELGIALWTETRFFPYDA